LVSAQGLTNSFDIRAVIADYHFITAGDRQGRSVLGDAGRADLPSGEISANEAIWKFFPAHPTKP
jgi:hypothetical protein